MQRRTGERRFVKGGRMPRGGEGVSFAHGEKGGGGKNDQEKGKANSTVGKDVTGGGWLFYLEERVGRERIKEASKERVNSRLQGVSV